MSFIDEVRAKRQKLADVLIDDDYSGIRAIVEELYPDRAHFIYELLQNAEDTNAHKASFSLYADRLVFEHDGSPFSEENVWAITNIGKGTKAGDEDAIGRFGVGFKAVFAYTETPRIWSPTYSFEISSLVLPSELLPTSDSGKLTRFEFPFNSPKKPARQAYAEVHSALRALSEDTLLFLSHINVIEWRVNGGSRGAVERIEHNEHHVEVIKDDSDGRRKASHYLRFAQPVTNLKKQRLAIAFCLETLPSATRVEPNASIDQRFRIVPARPGRVAIFFPAEKETSGLRFHLHAPFVPELSRASVKDTPANEPLFRQLEDLIAESLHTIRKLGLLSGDFLGVLPNPQDALPERYQQLRERILREMKTHDLTPTFSGTHAPAALLLQGKASLKNLLSASDVVVLEWGQKRPRDWAIGARQRNSDVDRFLGGLGIDEWDMENFVGALEDAFNEDSWGEMNERVAAWLAMKTDEWHQKCYALLYKELVPYDDFSRLKELRIVRLENGQYSVGRKCFFGREGEKPYEEFPEVEIGVYTAGKDKAEQESARKLLEAIGVRHVGEGELVEGVLKKRYCADALQPSLEDMERFVALVEREPSRATLFRDYYIFQRADGYWGRPDQVFLDAPFLDTGLSTYYEALGKDSGRVALGESYLDCGIEASRVVEFARKVGAKVEVESVDELKPLFSYVMRMLGYGRPDVPAVRFLWNGLSALGRKDPHVLEIRHRVHKGWGRYATNYVPSEFQLQLQNARWVPQSEENFVRPVEASPELLPEGFEYDSGWGWIKALRFGEQVARHSEEHRRVREMARELGFEDDESLKDAKWFSQLNAEERRKLKAEYQERLSVELPEHEPRDPGRRAARVGQAAASAPERLVERRERAISIGRDAVKEETDPYLRSEYTTGEVMICQVCKSQLPFRLPGGDYYFEAVEFLPELRRRYFQNYVALCPNHAAMFKYANGSRSLVMDSFLKLAGNEMELVLAGKKRTVYFTKAHIGDLRSVISEDGQLDVDGQGRG